MSDVEAAICPHDSMSGDEGPVVDLGRMPTRWRCDECGSLVHDSGPRPRRSTPRGRLISPGWLPMPWKAPLMRLDASAPAPPTGAALRLGGSLPDESSAPARISSGTLPRPQSTTEGIGSERRTGREAHHRSMVSAAQPWFRPTITSGSGNRTYCLTALKLTPSRSAISPRERNRRVMQGSLPHRALPTRYVSKFADLPIPTCQPVL